MRFSKRILLLLILLFSLALRDGINPLGFHCEDSLKAGFLRVGEAISDWLCPDAYAATKGNPPAACWRFDESSGPAPYKGLCRKADFFQGDFMESILIAAKSLTRIQNLYTSKLPFRVIINSNSFSEVFGGNRSFFKSNVEGVDLGVVGDSHISSFSRVIYINRYYNNFVFFFYEDWPYLLSFIESIVPGIFERKITTALHSVNLSRFPASCANSLPNFFFSGPAKANLFFSMFTEANHFRNIIHGINISRAIANVKGVIAGSASFSHCEGSFGSLQPKQSLKNVIASSAAFTSRLAMTVDSWLCPDAYAATKGNPPVACPQYSSSGQESASRERSREASLTVLDSAFGLARTILVNVSQDVRSNSIGIWTAFSDWLIPSAYAATKGNPPVGHWKFDEGGGATAYDESANNNDGTLTPGAAGTNTAAGQMWSRQGKIGSALECDGTDDYVNLPEPPASSTNISIGSVFAWIKTNNAGASYRGIVVKEGSYAMYLKDNVFIIYDSTVPADRSTGINVADNQWHFVGFTFQSGIANGTKLYIDGVEKLTTTLTITNQTQGVIFGAGNNPGTLQFFNGLIDDVRLYNYSRTAEQVLQDFNAGFAAHLGAGTDANEGSPPVGYWPLDENTGTIAYDRSGSGYNGTITAAAWGQGKNGPCLNFSGTNDKVQTADPILTGTGDFSITAWVYPTGATSDVDDIAGNYGIGNTGGIEFYIYQTKLYCYIGTPVIGVTSLNADTWYHVAVTRTSGAIKLYVNGVQDGSGTLSGSIANLRNFAIGNGPDYTSEKFEGKIDEVKVYNYARSAGQIAFDYNRGKPVAHYKFDEGTGTISHNEYSTADTGAAPVGWWRMDNSWVDASGNGYNGTAGGSATFSASSKIGPYGGSFNSATSDYVSITNPSTSQVFTTSFWFRTSTPAANMYLLDRGGNIRWFELLNSKLRTGTSAAYFSDSTTTIQADTWYHAAMTYDGTTIKQYINGVQQFSIAGGNTTPSGLQVGRYYTGGYYFSGLIDDLRIYNYARTAEQIYNDYRTTQGTLVGDTKFVDGKINKALQFDGTADYVIVPHEAGQISMPLTVAAWVKSSTINQGDWKAIVSKYPPGASNGWNIDSSSGNYYFYYFKDASNNLYAGGYGSSFGAATTSWSHLVAVVDTTGLSLYRDGALVNTRSWTGTAGASTQSAPLRIGCIANGTEAFNGLVDDVAIYNYARSAEQVLQDYNAGVGTRLGSQSAGEADPWGGAMPVAWWKMDENTGKLANDASGNGINGTLNGDSTWTQGKNGPGLSFDGSGDYVLIPGSSILDLQSMTISCWTYSTNYHANMFMFEKTTNGAVNTQYSLFFNAGGSNTQIYYRTYGLSVVDLAVTDHANGPVNSRWNHMAATYNSSTGTKKIYCNGIEIASATGLTGTITTNASGTSWIGAYGGGSGYPFNGKIDDVRIYNYARTPAQIAWDYNRGKPVGHWRMNEATSGSAVGTNNIKDDSGNSSHGSGAGTNIAWATGKFGGGLSFNGTDDYVSVTQTLSVPITVSCWAKLTDFAKTLNTFINSSPHTVLCVSLNRTGIGDIYVYIGNGTSWVGVPGIISSSNMVVNKWHHVSYTCDGTTSRLYLDGVSVGSVNIVPSGWGSYFNLGRIIQSGEYLKGSMDDVRVYNYARTAEQILQDYNNGLGARLGD